MEVSIMEQQILVNLGKILSPSYSQVVWGVGYTPVELIENAPLKNGNPTAFLHEYDLTLREQALPLNIMDVCNASFAWVSETPAGAEYYPYDYEKVVSLSNYPFAKNPWINQCADKTVYPGLAAVKGKVFVPAQVPGVDKLVNPGEKYVYLLRYFDQVVLDIMKNPDAMQTLKSVHPAETDVELFREAVYSIPPQALWGDCYCMAPMGATHVLLALQKAAESLGEGEQDIVNRYFRAVEAQKYAVVNRFSSTGMRTAYQEFVGRRNGTSVLQAGGDTYAALAAVKIYGVAPYSQITQPLIFNDANCFVDFALKHNWANLSHRTQLELAEFYAKFSSLKSISHSLEFGRRYCDVEKLRMINLVSVDCEERVPSSIPPDIREQIAGYGLPGFAKISDDYQPGDTAVPNPAAIALIKKTLDRGLPVCCGGAISGSWFSTTQKYGCVPPAAVDDMSSYDGGHETLIVGMCQYDESDKDILELFTYWKNRAAQVEDKDNKDFSSLSKERQDVYNKEKYLLFIMNSWNYWYNKNLFTQGVSALDWIPKSKAVGEKSIWMNDEENEENCVQLGTSPILGATPEQRGSIPSHVYILPGSYLFYLSSLVVPLSPTYLSAGYQEDDVAKTDVNAAFSLFRNMGGGDIAPEHFKPIGIRIDSSKMQ